MNEDGYRLDETAPPVRQGRAWLEFSQPTADRICELIIDGQSLRTICLAEDMPSRTTVLKWLRENEDFASQYAHARVEQQDTYAEEIVHIADTEEDPQKARVRIDARKWHASKLAPQKYGDRVTSVIEGGEKPLEVAAAKPRDLAKAMALILAKGLKPQEGDGTGD